MKIPFLGASFGALLAGSAFAAPVGVALPEPQLVLKPGPGADIAATDCSACHSLDYILTQPPHMGDKFWDAEVQKMIKAFGAPIPASDAQTIASYLKATY
jgi:sulfite dehydrogenase (cytochrome) subunit B